MDHHQHQKKEFSYPKREEVIEQIRELDEDIQHVSLNLIKCSFDATEKDVEKAFPEYKFLKVKNYNPGSFQVVFDMRIDAINFIRNCFDHKILGRRFFIKLGRQQKDLLEDWACVGYVPKKNFHNKKFDNKDHKGPRRDQKPEHKGEQKEQQKGEPKVEGTTEQKQAQPTTTEVKKEVHQKVEAPKVEGEHAVKKGVNIPNNYPPKTQKTEKTNNHEKKQKTHPEHKKQQPHKFVHHKPEHKVQTKAEHKVEHKAQGKTEHKGEHKVQNKAEHKGDHKQQHKPEKKQTEKKYEAKVHQAAKPKQQPKKQQPKHDDNDGWITVPVKNKKR